MKAVDRDQQYVAGLGFPDLRALALCLCRGQRNESRCDDGSTGPATAVRRLRCDMKNRPLSGCLVGHLFEGWNTFSATLRRTAGGVTVNFSERDEAGIRAIRSTPS